MSRKLFYRGASVMTVVQGQNTIHLLKAATVPLGQLSINASSRATLYTGDLAHSILGARHQEKLQAINYGVYGHVPAHSMTAVLGYNGELFDLLGMYYLGGGNRMYSPHVMRFLSPDRKGVFTPGNFNSYAYAGGDPVNRSDPSGNQWVWTQGHGKLVNISKNMNTQPPLSFENHEISSAVKQRVAAAQEYVSRRREVVGVSFEDHLAAAELRQVYALEVQGSAKAVKREIAAMVRRGDFPHEWGDDFLDAIIGPVTPNRSVHTVDRGRMGEYRTTFSPDQYSRYNSVVSETEKISAFSEFTLALARELVRVAR